MRANAPSLGENTVAAGGGRSVRVSYAVGWATTLLFSAVCVCIATAFVHVIPYGRAIRDYLFLLDGAYRIDRGQVPHIDFASPIGALTLYMTWLSGRIFPHGQPFAGLHALMWLACLPPMAVLAPRLKSKWRFAFALALLALMVLLPFTLDETHLSEISYFATYNRFATAGLFLIGLWYVLPKRRDDWITLAYIVTLLLFLKITAAAAACGLLLMAFLLRHLPLRTLALTVLAVAIPCGLLEAATGIVSAYVGDVVRLGMINGGTSVYSLAAAAIHNCLPLAAAAALTILALREHRHPSSLNIALDTMVLVGVALLAESQNTGGIGLICAAALLFHPDLPIRSQACRTAGVVFAAALVLPLVGTAIDRTLTAIVRERSGTTQHGFAALLPGMRVSATTLQGARLFRLMTHSLLPLAEEIQARRFNLVNDPTDNAPAFMAAWAEDAVDAARVFRDRGLEVAGGRYATLAFVDPFARLLSLSPARGVSLVMHVGRTVPLFDQAGASRYLSQASGVFRDTCEISNGEKTNQAVFDAVLAAEFVPSRLNECWTFHRRRAIAPS